MPTFITGLNTARSESVLSVQSMPAGPKKRKKSKRHSSKSTSVAVPVSSRTTRLPLNFIDRNKQIAEAGGSTLTKDEELRVEAILAAEGDSTGSAVNDTKGNERKGEIPTVPLSGFSLDDVTSGRMSDIDTKLGEMMSQRHADATVLQEPKSATEVERAVVDPIQQQREERMAMEKLKQLNEALQATKTAFKAPDSPRSIATDCTISRDRLDELLGAAKEEITPTETAKAEDIQKLLETIRNE